MKLVALMTMVPLPEAETDRGGSCAASNHKAVLTPNSRILFKTKHSSRAYVEGGAKRRPPGMTLSCMALTVLRAACALGSPSMQHCSQQLACAPSLASADDTCSAHSPNCHNFDNSVSPLAQADWPARR